MIQQTLKLIAGKLNDQFQNLWQNMSDTVILAPVTAPEGSIPDANLNKVLVTVVNIENETRMSTYTAQAAGAATYAVIAPPLYIDLNVLYSANFSDYSEALKAITETISFFQRNPAFTTETLPGLDPAIDKLSFELQNLSLTDLNQLWSIHGGHYLPSVVYKIRLFPFSSAVMTPKIPAVQNINP